MTNGIDNLLEFVQFNIEYEYISLSNLYWKPLKIANTSALDNVLFDKFVHLSGAGVIIQEKGVLICGGYNSKTSEEYNHVFSLNIALKENLIDLSLDLYEIKSSLTKSSWFAEKMFFEKNGKYFCCDVDGNIIIFDQNSTSFERIEFDFYSQW